MIDGADVRRRSAQAEKHCPGGTGGALNRRLRAADPTAHVSRHGGGARDAGGPCDHRAGAVLTPAIGFEAFKQARRHLSPPVRAFRGLGAVVETFGATCVLRATELGPLFTRVPLNPEFRRGSDYPPRRIKHDAAVFRLSEIPSSNRLDGSPCCDSSRRPWHLEIASLGSPERIVPRD